MSRKRASGFCRGLVLLALQDAVAEHGPRCFPSKRAAAEALVPVVGFGRSTIMRALTDPLDAELEAVIRTAIEPCAPFGVGAHQGAAAAGFGSEPVREPVGEPVVSQGEPPSKAASTLDASPQHSPGEPVREPDRPSRERVFHPSSTTEPEQAPASSPLAPPLPTSLGRRPKRLARSRFAGECFVCCCYVPTGAGSVLVPYAQSAGARLFCEDHAWSGLELAQLEWDLANPSRRQSTLFSPHTHQTEE